VEEIDISLSGIGYCLRSFFAKIKCTDVIFNCILDSHVFKKYLQCVLAVRILTVDFVVCTLAVKKKIRAGFDMSDRTIPLSVLPHPKKLGEKYPCV
jgi:hypothetical protein